MSTWINQHHALYDREYISETIDKLSRQSTLEIVRALNPSTVEECTQVVRRYLNAGIDKYPTKRIVFTWCMEHRLHVPVLAKCETARALLLALSDVWMNTETWDA